MHQKVPTSHKQTLYKYLYFITRTNTTVNVETIRLIKQKKKRQSIDCRFIHLSCTKLFRKTRERISSTITLWQRIPWLHASNPPPTKEDLSQFFVFFVRVIRLDNSSFRSTDEIQHHITLRTLGNLLLHQLTSV